MEHNKAPFRTQSPLCSQETERVSRKSARLRGLPVETATRKRRALAGDQDRLNDICDDVLPLVIYTMLHGFDTIVNNARTVLNLSVCNKRLLSASMTAPWLPRVRAVLRLCASSSRWLHHNIGHKDDLVGDSRRLNSCFERLQLKELNKVACMNVLHCSGSSCCGFQTAFLNRMNYHDYTYNGNMKSCSSDHRSDAAAIAKQFFATRSFTRCISLNSIERVPTAQTIVHQLKNYVVLSTATLCNGQTIELRTSTDGVFAIAVYFPDTFGSTGKVASRRTAQQCGPHQFTLSSKKLKPALNMCLSISHDPKDGQRRMAWISNPSLKRIDPLDDANLRSDGILMDSGRHLIFNGLLTGTADDICSMKILLGSRVYADDGSICSKTPYSGWLFVDTAPDYQSLVQRVNRLFASLVDGSNDADFDPNQTAYHTICFDKYTDSSVSIAVLVENHTFGYRVYAVLRYQLQQLMTASIRRSRQATSERVVRHDCKAVLLLSDPFTVSTSAFETEHLQIHCSVCPVTKSIVVVHHDPHESDDNNGCILFDTKAHSFKALGIVSLMSTKTMRSTATHSYRIGDNLITVMFLVVISDGMLTLYCYNVSRLRQCTMDMSYGLVAKSVVHSISNRSSLQSVDHATRLNISPSGMLALLEFQTSYNDSNHDRDTLESRCFCIELDLMVQFLCQPDGQNYPCLKLDTYDLEERRNQWSMESSEDANTAFGERLARVSTVARWTETGFGIHTYNGLVDIKAGKRGVVEIQSLE